MSPIGSRAAHHRPSTALARALAAPRPSRVSVPSVGALVGLEHEFRVRLDGRPVDFRQVIHRLPIDGLRIDPADADAYRCRWGGTITADGREAEIAVPPLAGSGEIGGRVVAAAARARAELAAVLPAGATIEGYSTHLSVSVPDDQTDRVADRVIRHFGAALTLLLDGPASPGLLVRPRRGRVEIGGEYLDGPDLAVVTAFALGAVRAAARRSPWAGRTLPPALAVQPEAAVERFGWFIGDTALGASLHAEGRAAVLRLAAGGTMTAAEHLARAWAAVGRELPDLAPDLRDRIDALVAGRSRLAVERPVEEVGRVSPDPVAPLDPDAAFASATRRRGRPGFAVDPVVLSWDFAVLRLSGGRREAYACLPRLVLGDALAALDAGRLDHLLRAYLFADGPAPGREPAGEWLLSNAGQTAAVGLYRGLGKAADLAGVERGPLGGGGKRQRRPDQPSSQPAPAPKRLDPARTTAKAGTAAAAAGLTILGLPVAAAAAIGGVAIVAVIGGVLLLGGGGGGSSPTPLPSVAAAASQPAAASASIAVASVAPPSVSPSVPVPSIASAPEVDLVFTGSRPFTARGVGGRCIGGGGFAFEGTEADFPGMGLSFSLASFGGDPDLKWVIDDDAAYGFGNGSSATAAADGLSATIDAELAPFTNQSTGATPGPEHVTGTIVCPGGSSAGPAPSTASIVGDPICDAWVSTPAVVAVVGSPAVALSADNFLNDGQPVDCTWTFADGRTLNLVALEQPDYGQLGDYRGSDGSCAGGVTCVDGLGLEAAYWTSDNVPSELDWFPDHQLMFQLGAATTNGPALTAEQLIQIARLVSVPAVLPVAP